MNTTLFSKRLVCVLLLTLTCWLTNTKQPEWVNVYVHGTTMTMGNYLIENYYPELGYGTHGLNHISTLSSDCLFLKDVDHLASDTNKFDLDHFYSFAWSGLCSFYEREVAGKQLYQALQELLQNYQQEYDYYPKIRIITFSHGGNVVLNMAKHLPYFNDAHVYLELVFIACPVQKPTQHVLKHSEIDHIYTIASTKDYLQILDGYFFEKWLHFPGRHFCINQKNCKEIKVFVNGYGITHTDMLRSIMPHIPEILNQADAWFANNDHSETFDCHLNDPHFPFYNGFNILTALYGKKRQQTVQEQQTN